MNWKTLPPSNCSSHHITPTGSPAYSERFDEVLKFHAPGLAPVRRGVTAWHIKIHGEPAYIRRFERTFGFYEAHAAVIDKDGWHHITTDGSDSYTDRYAWCGNFQGGRCAVRLADGSYLHIDATGAAAYTRRWRYAGDFRDGVAVVQAADGRSSHISTSGELLHDRWFLDLDVFHKGLARARDETGWTHVDENGKARYSRRFGAVEPFYNGQARVELFNGAFEVVDEAGTTLVELRPPRCSEFAALSGDLVGFWRTQTIAAAVKLGIFEALPCQDAQLADRCGLQPDRGRRILRALTELHLVVQDQDRWRLTERGQFLQSGHPLTLADAALEYAGAFSRSWELLPSALRAESGWIAPDVFHKVALDDNRREAHHRMLRSYARHDYSAVVTALDLHGDERIVDAGGGTGALAKLVAIAHPRTHVTVLDLPEVVKQAQREEAAETVSWAPGDIFDEWPLDADVVILSRVLHDWDDEAALQILQRARATLSDGGRVFIIEMLLLDDHASGSLCDLHLLMATGGRERTPAEFEHLLTRSGFELSALSSASSLPSIMIGVAS